MILILAVHILGAYWETLLEIFTNPNYDIPDRIRFQFLIRNLKWSKFYLKLTDSLQKRDNKIFRIFTIVPVSNDLLKTRKLVSHHFNGQKVATLVNDLKLGQMKVFYVTSNSD